MSATVDRAGVVAWLRAFAAAVAHDRDHLTALDAAIGDADHGINMDRGMQAVVARLDELTAVDEPAAGGIGGLLKTVGMTLVSTVGGAAGPLYGSLFLAMGAAAGQADELGTGQWASAFAAGVEAAQARGKAELQDKTMIDALIPAAQALEAGAASGGGLADALRGAAEAARQGMEATTPLVARKGRASYLGERSAGCQDPGATSSWLLVRTAAEALVADGPPVHPGTPP
jgi:phosphoenolpyruvate---glycerone phosphotransferase subunit DhaL